MFLFLIASLLIFTTIFCILRNFIPFLEKINQFLTLIEAIERKSKKNIFSGSLFPKSNNNELFSIRNDAFNRRTNHRHQLAL